jgi:Holliday junction DNA helicase RuvA
VISGVEGTLVARNGDRVTVRTTGGVTYDVLVPLGVLERLPAEGRDVRLRTVLVVREDGWALYGFTDGAERELFRRLLGASGVGPKLALAMVSTLGFARLVRSIRDGDLAALSTVPGIGKKTAERIVLELKDRLKDLGVPGAPAGATGPAEQATQALVNLGYSAGEAERAVRGALAADAGLGPVDLIRQALQLLTTNRR